MKFISLVFILLSSISFGQTPLLFDTFQTGIPLYYTMVNSDGFTPNTAVSEYTSAWIAAEDPDDPTNIVASSTSYFTPVGRADRWLITPQITLGAYGNSLSWNGKSHDATYPEDYIVMLSKTTNDLTSFTDTLGWVFDETEQWTTYNINLSEKGYDNETIYLAFGLRTFDGFKVYLDSIQVFKDDPAGISSENNELDFTIYPNPASQLLNVDFIGELDQIRIFDLSGSEVYVGKNKVIDLQDIQSGIYFVELISGNSKAVKRFVKN